VASAVQTWHGYADQYAAKLHALADVMMDRLAQVVLRDDDAFNVLIHGDLWVNNMLFRYRRSGAPDQVRFIDFQFLHFSSPAIDLRYFFNTSTCDDVRQEDLENLMKVRFKCHLTLSMIWTRYIVSKCQPLIIRTKKIKFVNSGKRSPWKIGT
jgi:thiamine kinase-like enzyme